MMCAKTEAFQNSHYWKDFKMCRLILHTRPQQFRHVFTFLFSFVQFVCRVDVFLKPSKGLFVLKKKRYLHNNTVDVLQNVSNQTVLVSVDFHCLNRKHWDVSKNVFLCLFYQIQLMISALHILFWNGYAVINMSSKIDRRYDVCESWSHFQQLLLERFWEPWWIFLHDQNSFVLYLLCGF